MSGLLAQVDYRQIKNKPVLDARDFFWLRTNGSGINVATNVLTAGIGKSVTLSPCPKGVSGTNLNHPIRIFDGSGTEEVTYIAGGSCISGATSGTIIIDVINTHSGAFKISTATHGIREAIFSGEDRKEVNVTDNFPILYGPVYIPGGWKISGNGINDASTRFQIPASFPSTAPGIFVGLPNAYFVQLEDFAIECIQPNSPNLADYNHQPPAIYIPTSPRSYIRNIGIFRCWDGIKMLGNGGGTTIENLWTSTFHYGIHMDQVLDSIRILNWHHWPFGLSGHQFTAFNSIDVWAGQFGRVDGLDITNLMTISGSGLRFYPGIDGNGSNSRVNSTQFDGHTGLTMEVGSLLLTNCYFSMASNVPGPGITHKGGSLFLSNVDMFSLSNDYSPIHLNYTTAGRYTFNYIGGRIHQQGVTETRPPAIDTNTVSGAVATINISNIRFDVPGTLNYTKPLINIPVSGAGGAIRAMITNNTGPDKGPFSTPWIVLGGDGFNTVLGNQFPGWSYTFPNPPAFDIGLYQGRGGNFRKLSIDEIKINTVPEYADNATALGAGLSIGSPYRTGDVAKWVH